MLTIWGTIALLASLRITGVMVTAPLFAGASFPWSARILASALVTLALLPGLSTADVSMGEGHELVSAAVRELAIGLILGGGVAVLFSAVQLVGDLLARLSGLNWGADDGAATSDPVTRCLTLTGLAIYLALQGPESLVMSVGQTFDTIPLGSPSSNLVPIELLTALLTDAVWIALRGVGPALAAFFAAGLLLTFLQRTLPRFQLFFAMFPTNTLLLWGALILCLSGGLALFSQAPGETLQAIAEGLREAR